MIKTGTRCCAFGQISRVNNETTIKDLSTLLIQLKKEAEQKHKVEDPFNQGQTSVFIMATMPAETPLVDKLLRLGFSKTHIFARRNGYPKGWIEMYTKNLVPVTYKTY